MRIWDRMNPTALCGQHLLAQWREGLGLWNILTLGKKGYANHPETKRWVGFEDALWWLLADTRSAMLQRGWNPKPLPTHTAKPCVNPAAWDDQLATLRAKRCQCNVPPP